MSIEEFLSTFPMLFVPIIFWLVWKVNKLEAEQLGAIKEDVAEMKTDIKWLSKTFVPGDGLDYGTLDVTFIVDKNLTNYRSILSWLKRINSPDTQEQFNYNKFSETMSNINLICTDAAQEPLAEWKFKDAFPIGLDGFTFDASMQDIEYITANVSFRFLYFESVIYNNGTVLNQTI